MSPFLKKSHEYLSVWEGNKFRGRGRDCLFLAEFQPSKPRKLPLRLISLGDLAKAQHFQRWWPQREVSCADLEKCLDSFSSTRQAEGVTLLLHSMSATRWRGSLNFLKVFIPLSTNIFRFSSLGGLPLDHKQRQEMDRKWACVAWWNSTLRLCLWGTR